MAYDLNESRFKLALSLYHGQLHERTVKRDLVGNSPQKNMGIRPLLSRCEMGRMSTHDLGIDVDARDQHIPTA